MSSPGRATGIANWISSGKLGMDRPRSSSVPLVLYKQKYTIQFDRQQSLMAMAATPDEHGTGTLAFSSSQKPSSKLAVNCMIY